MAKKIGRRDFIKKSAKIGISTALGSSVLYQVIGHSGCAPGEMVDMAVVA